MRAEYVGLLTARYRLLGQQDLRDPNILLDTYLYKVIFPRIGGAILKGKVYISIDAELIEGARARLEALGYAVVQTDNIDPATRARVIETSIYWAKHLPKT